MATPALKVTASLSDIELMLGVRDDASGFFEPLLRRHRNSLIHFLFRMVNDAAAAEDLAQEVFLTVYRTRKRYEPSAKFTAWLYRIAKNRAINWVRDNRSRRQSVSLEQLAKPRASAIPSPEQELLQRERRSRIQNAVHALPERQRVAVLLHKYAEMEYVQIAEVLGCSLSAVRSILNRAYVNLRESIPES